MEPITHPLSEDHKKVLAALEELGQAVVGIQTLNGGELASRIVRVKGPARVLFTDLQIHLKKEEEALFPPLEELIGAEAGPPYVMREEHKELRPMVERLSSLIVAVESGQAIVADDLRRVAEGIILLLRSHIQKEDAILFPMIEAHLDEEQKARAKAGMDAIGAASGGITLDVRPMPPWERHPRIFEAFDGLKPGGTLTIINDHDPKPLQYQFAAERQGQFQWISKEVGPREWVATITKVAA